LVVVVVVVVVVVAAVVRVALQPNAGHGLLVHEVS
jgi:hypothetical protein